jgi:hypothetical protein
MSDDGARHGYSIRLFVSSVDPEKLRGVVKSNRNRRALVTPRGLFAETMTRSELDRARKSLQGAEERE